MGGSKWAEPVGIDSCAFPAGRHEQHAFQIAKYEAFGESGELINRKRTQSKAKSAITTTTRQHRVLLQNCTAFHSASAAIVAIAIPPLLVLKKSTEDADSLWWYEILSSRIGYDNFYTVSVLHIQIVQNVLVAFRKGRCPIWGIINHLS